MSFVRTLLLFASVTAVACAVDVSGLPSDGAVSGECMGDEECADSVDCTDDTCSRDGVCVHTEIDSRCAGGEVCIAATGCQPESACNADDCADALRVALTCQVGACQADGTCLGETTCAAGESCCGDGSCMDCDDGNPCTDDSCDSSGCVHMPLDGTACDDMQFCTGTEVCVAGTCQSSGDPCESPTVCNVDRCVGCRNAGDCPDDIMPPYGSCEYTDTCDNSAVRRRTVTSFACVSEVCVGTDTEDTDNCSRNTNGTGCGSDSVGPWSGCAGFSDTCDETGTRSRQRTTFTCGSGSCNSSTASENGDCNRDTDGTMCMATTTPSWGACGEFSDMCDETGVQRRTITTFNCASASCAGTDMARMQSCNRDTDGMMDCGTPRSDEVTACMKTPSGDSCDKEGTRMRTTYGTMCMDGSCVQVPSTTSEACSIETDGDSCGSAGACVGECSGGDCDLTVNDGTACGGGGDCAGTCDAGSCDMAARNGSPCDDGIACTGDGTCTDGTCSMGGDGCGGGDCATSCGSACDCRPDGGGGYACLCMDG